MRYLACLFAISLASTAFAAEPAAPKDPHAGMTPPTHPRGDKGAPMLALTRQGSVLSSIDVPSYTYIEVRQGKETRWLAAASIKVKKGDIIRFDDGMVMTNFFSKSLNRGFPSIVFVNKVEVGDKKM